MAFGSDAASPGTRRRNNAKCDAVALRTHRRRAAVPAGKTFDVWDPTTGSIPWTNPVRVQTPGHTVNVGPHQHRPIGGQTLRYDVTVEMIYLAGHDLFPEDARAALQSAVVANFASGNNADVTLTALTVDRHDSAVETRATLHGNGPIDLTSPVDAVTRIDAAICQSLLRLGLYEEFDVASRSIKAAPAQPPRP